MEDEKEKRQAGGGLKGHKLRVSHGQEPEAFGPRSRVGPSQAEELLRIERDLAISLGGAGSLREALDLLLEAATGLEGVDVGAVYLVNCKTGDVDLTAHRGHSAWFTAMVSHYGPDTPAAKLLKSGEPAYWPEPGWAPDTDELFEREAIRAAAVLPVTFGGKVVAVLCLGSRTRSEIPHNIRNVIEAIAAQIGEIVARLEAEDAHRRLLERYRVLFDKANDAIFVLGLTPDHKLDSIIDVNGVACAKLGYTREEMLSLSPPQLEAAECADTLAAAMRKLLEESQVLFEMTLVAKDGRKIPFEVSAHLFDLDGGPTVFSINRDISGRRRGEQALRKSEALYRAIVEDQTELICRFTHDGVLTFVNDAYCRYFDKSREDLLGVSFLPLLPPKDREEFESYLRSLSREHPTGSIMHQVVAPGGEVRWQQWTDRAIFAESGAIVEFQSVGRDVTVLKQTVEALRDARDNLEREVAERTAGLALANERLSLEIEERKLSERSLRESEERLRVLSLKLLTVLEEERHRLAQELHDSIGQAMVGAKYRLEHFQKALLCGSLEGGFEDSKQLIGILQNGIEETRRICTGLRPFILDDFGILAGIEWLCEQIRIASASLRVEEELLVEEKDIPDALKIVIFRVLQEALSNILKHSKADLVKVGLRAAGECLQLTVDDNGSGFDPASGLSEHPSRRGLGLMTMRERTELSGGSFSLKSSAGNGTSISVSWRCKGRGEQREAAERELDKRDKRDKRDLRDLRGSAVT